MRCWIIAMCWSWRLPANSANSTCCRGGAERSPIEACNKREERGEGYILRLFEPTGEPRETAIVMNGGPARHPVSLQGFEIKTYRLHPVEGVREVSLLERPLR